MRFFLFLSVLMIILSTLTPATYAETDECFVWMEVGTLYSSGELYFEINEEISDYEFTIDGDLVYSNISWASEHGIFIYNIDTQTSHPLVTMESSDLREFGDLSISTDNRLAFNAVVGFDEGYYRLFVLDGLGLHSYPVQGFGADWSPDNQHIVFYQYDTDGGNPTVMVIDLNTLETYEIGSGISPQWSPNGEYIAYQTGYYDQIVLYTVEDKTSETLSAVGVLGITWIDDENLLYSGREEEEAFENSIWTYNLVSDSTEEVYSITGTHMVNPSLCP